MSVLVHISDFHFGREDPAVAEGLVEDLRQLNPTLLINSGDFTQRARRSQFQSAAEFMSRLPSPKLSIPGNHDIPLFDIVRRFVTPLNRYKRFISEDLFPVYQEDHLIVLGLNTARSMTWKNGRISGEQILKMEQILKESDEHSCKVVVTHHPFIPPPGQEETGVDLVGRAVKGLEVIEHGGVDLLLAGHLHQGYTGDVQTYYPSTKRSIIAVQAGTAISRRIRHEPNGYNVLRLSSERIEIEIRVWDGSQFTTDRSVLFEREQDRWVLQSGEAVALVGRSGRAE